jgi:GAF domain
MRASQNTSSNHISQHHSSRGRFEEVRTRDTSWPASRSAPASVETRESLALHRIAATTGEEPYAVLQGLLSAAVDLCGGGADTSTAGVSLLEPTPEGSEQFRWVALAGCLADHIGGTTPRNFSPCGECLDKGEPMILARPDLKYDYFRAAGIEFTEGLVLPFATNFNSRPLGTIWVVSHPPKRHRFNAEDARVMESLASFAAAAYSLATARDKADGTKREHENVVAAMSQEMRTPLNTIAASVYLLTLEVQGALNAGQLEHLSRIQKAVQLLMAGVNGLADSARSDEQGRGGADDVPGVARKSSPRSRPAAVNELAG